MHAPRRGASSDLARRSSGRGRCVIPASLAERCPRRKGGHLWADRTAEAARTSKIDSFVEPARGCLPAAVPCSSSGVVWSAPLFFPLRRTAISYTGGGSGGGVVLSGRIRCAALRNIYPLGVGPPLCCLCSLSFCFLWSSFYIFFSISFVRKIFAGTSGKKKKKFLRIVSVLRGRFGGALRGPPGVHVD